MKTSRKLSLASFAAIGLPVVGIAGATAQAMNPAAPEASVSVTGGNELVLQSNAATNGSLSTVNRNLRSNGNISQIATVTGTTDAEIAGAEAVEASGIDPMRGWAESDLDAYAAYWEAGYNYNQLLTLAEEWNLSEFEAKARAGDAILSGDTSSFEDIVAGIDPFASELATYDPEAPGPADPFWDAGFSYDDAVALAEAWNVDSWDAKIMASEMIAAGNQADVEAVLSV